MPNGSNKGAAFERKICRMLSEWWTNGARDDVFWRTSQSGGRATERAKKGQTTSGQYGDIAATDPIGKPLIDCFMFELKHGYSKTPFINLSQCVLAPFVLKWMTKLNNQAAKAGTLSWALIYKADNKATLIILPVSFFQLHAPDLRARVLAMTHIITPWNVRNGLGDDVTDNVLIMPFEAFLQSVGPEQIPQPQHGNVPSLVSFMTEDA